MQGSKEPWLTRSLFCFVLSIPRLSENNWWDFFPLVLSCNAAVVGTNKNTPGTRTGRCLFAGRTLFGESTCWTLEYGLCRSARRSCRVERLMIKCASLVSWSRIFDSATGEKWWSLVGVGCWMLRVDFEERVSLIYSMCISAKFISNRRSLMHI